MKLNRLASLMPNGHAAKAERTSTEEIVASVQGAGRWFERIVVQNPRASLVSAVFLGAALAWLVKRR